MPDFEGDQQSDRLHTVVPYINLNNTSVHIIAHEQIIGVGNIAANLEQFHEVMKLAVDIAADDDGRPNRDYIGLLHEDFFGLSYRGGTFSHRALTSS